MPILNLNQFLILPQLPQKMKLASKVATIDSKEMTRKQRSKSVKLTVALKQNEIASYLGPLDQHGQPDHRRKLVEQSAKTVFISE
jgi:hypothetical protein